MRPPEIATATHPYRWGLLFIFAVLLQVGFLRTIGNAGGGNPFGVVVAAGMIAPFLLMALAFRPHIGLLCVPVLVVIPGWLVGFTAFECLLLLSLFLAMLGSMASGNMPTSLSRLEWLYGLYAIWAGITVLQAIDMPEALVGIKIVVMLFVAFIAGTRFIGAGRARTLVQCVALLSVVISAQLLFVILHSGYPLSFLLTRAGSLTDLGWGTSNYIAAVAALSTSCAIPLAFYGGRWEKVLGVSSLGAAVFVSIITISRGGTLAILAGILVTTAIEARRRFFLAVGILLILILSYVLSPLGQASIARFIDPRDLPSVAERILYYQETVRIIGEHLFLGVGPNQIPQHSSFYIGANPHNFVLKLAADFGLPGATLYLIMLTIAAGAAGRLLRVSTDRDTRLLGLSFVLLLVIACTSGSYEPTLEGSVYGTVFWMTLGALYAAALAIPSRREGTE